MSTGSEIQSRNSSDKPWLWKPGQSGNPKGRPRGKTLTSYLRIIAEEQEDSGETKGERLARVLWAIGVSGDRQAISDIFTRLDGKPSDKSDEDDDEQEQAPRIVIPGSDARRRQIESD